MAISPYNPTPASANPAINTASTKSLTILNNTNKPASGFPTSTEAFQDLSEKLNEEVKRQYVKDTKLGEGTYANVYKAHHRDDPKRLYAIKKIKVNAEYKDGITMDSIREIKFLQELSHPNIIKLYAVFSSKNQNLNLVLELLPRGDLEMLIKDHAGVHYGPADVKAWMGMLCRAVWFCHANFVLHRDIKPNNLLIAADGEVKLADFGLARSFADPQSNMTSNVITRWYRPPELFYGANSYSGAVDIWSVGVVFAELVLRQYWLPGNTDIEQIEKISQVFGSPTEEVWPGVSKLSNYVAPETILLPWPADAWDYNFGLIGPVGIKLLKSMLILSPRRRLTAKEILQHEYWRMEPKPTKKEDLPRKAGGESKVGEDLKRRGGELEEGRADKVARKLDFSALRK